MAAINPEDIKWDNEIQINPKDIIWDKPKRKSTNQMTDSMMSQLVGLDRQPPESTASFSAKHSTPNEMAEDMMSQLAGLDRQPPGHVRPFSARHPNITAAAQTVGALPGQVGELGQEIVAGVTWGASERADEAAQYLSDKLFGKSKSPKKKAPYLPDYIRGAARFGGGMATIGGAHKIIATPIVQLVSKSKYLRPFGSMIGWGTTGSTFHGVSTMIQEGELPTPKELAEHGAQWAAIAGVFGILGWTGKLSAGIERLHRTWKIPRKEVVKVILKEAKLRKMPIASYTHAKAGTQKALSLKEAKSAHQLLYQIERTGKVKRGDYGNLVKQIEDQDIKARIGSFRKHIGETKIIGEKPKAKGLVTEPKAEIERILSKPAFQRSAEEIAILNKTKSGIEVIPVAQPRQAPSAHVKFASQTKKVQHPLAEKMSSKQILTEILPGWIKRTGEDIRLGTYVSKKHLQEYKDFFKERPSLYKPQAKKYPIAKVLSKPTKTNKVTLESPWGKRGPRVLKENLPKWVQDTGHKIRSGDKISQVELKRYKEYFKDRASVYTPERAKEIAKQKTIIPPVKKQVAKTPTQAVEASAKVAGKTKLEINKEARKITGPEKPEQGKLLAALRYPNGKVVTGHTHLHCLEKAEKEGLDKMLSGKAASQVDEGFINRAGQFLNRTEAKRVFGHGESVSLQRAGVITPKPDNRPFVLALHKKIRTYRKSGQTDVQIVSRLRREGSKNIDVTLAMNAIKEGKPSPGIHLGFGFTGEIQRIFDKIRGVKLHKHSKAKLAPVVKKEISKDGQLLIDALSNAEKIRGKQEEMYSIARGIKLEKARAVGEKTAGRAGFFAEKRALKGKLPRAEFTPIVSKLSSENIDNLFDQIKYCPTLQAWEIYPARTALEELLGEHGGTVPTKSGLKLLREVFGSDVTSALEKLSKHKFKDMIYNVINIPKAMRASYDISAALRQGIFLLGHPKAFYTAFKKQFKPLVSTKAFNEAQLEIQNRSSYNLMIKNQLSLTNLGKLSQREEAFASNFAERVPGVKASSQAFTSFLNRLRADVFEEFVTAQKKLGITDPKFLRDAAKYINHATGRGDLLKFEANAVELNLALFSPRLIMSRLQLLNPMFYKNLHPAVRKTALKDLFVFASLITTTCALGKTGGLDVGADPRNADFAKLKIGNVRYDIAGGFQQPVRLASQFLSGVYINSTTGQPETLGVGYKPLTRIGIVGRFGKGKLSPAAAFVMMLMGGQTDAEGRVDVSAETLELVTPMALQDLFDLYNEEGKKGVPMAVPAFFGVGVQTYGGVANYGLDGKDYSALNKELSRLKTTMGFPSVNVYSQELSSKDYKIFRQKTGTKIAKELTKTLKASYYQNATDNEKKYIISSTIARIKSDLKAQLFPKQRQIADLARHIKGATQMSHRDALDKAKKQLAQKR